MTNFLQIVLFSVAGMFAVAAVLGYWRARAASYLLLAGMVLLAIGIGSIYIPEHRWVPLYKGETALWFALAVSSCGYALFKLNTRSWLISIFAAFDPVHHVKGKILANGAYNIITLFVFIYKFSLKSRTNIQFSTESKNNDAYA